jgi:nucleotide-binding universal stress UspA family protein
VCDHAPVDDDEFPAARTSAAWPERIVVGVDASPESVLALDRALVLAARAGSTVVVVHAVGLLEGAHYRPAVDLDEILAQAQARAECPRELIAPPHTETGPPVEALTRVAHRVGGDLIVVGRRGQGAAWPLGSTSDGVLRTTTIPVLVVSSPRGDTTTDLPFRDGSDQTT